MSPLLLLLLPLLAAAAPAELTADRVVARVQKLYDGTKDFTAAFEQEYEMSALGRSQKSRGRVAFQKPGRIRFDYVEPTPKTFAVDGTTLWVYQPADNQALVDRCFRADGLTASLVFLGGTGRIAELFNLESAPGDAQHHVVRLVPKAPQGAYRSITLWVDRATFEVRRSVVEDPNGNPNRFAFADVRRNKGVKPEQVLFTPAATVAVDAVPGSCVQR
ncbi:MAG: outer membrane lipoprotein carrier protein LolA [Deltaproteobacteria bacterium]|nr:outer membrane lipoprotein carrier protein LolA [Deltaproteobacteria bacterium]